jgi:hypothetical protein
VTSTPALGGETWMAWSTARVMVTWATVAFEARITTVSATA